MTLRTVHTGRYGGFVTDFGGPLVFKRVDDGTTLTVPRYGVWQATRQGKVQVVHVCQDLAEAKRLCDQRPTDRTT
jgi:hypothetical protein